MGSMSLTHWIIVAIVVLILFGRGRISETMGEFGKGLRSFKQGMSEKDQPEAPGKAPQISQPQAEADKTGSATGDRTASDR